MSITIDKPPIVREGMSTLWGRAQTADVLTPWAGHVTTAGHGGLKIDAAHNAQIPADVRARAGWYEEDVDWAIPVCMWPKLSMALAVAENECRRRCDEAMFPVWNDEQMVARAANTLEQAKRTVRNSYPDFYERFYGVTLQPGESHARDEAAFYAQHANDWIVISAVGDHHPKVPKGMIFVLARLGGRGSADAGRADRCFLVTEADYQLPRTFGFVVDAARHQEVGPLE